MAEALSAELLQTRASEELNSLGHANQSIFESLGPDFKSENLRLLHYYTSAEGVKGILNDSKIHATNVEYLNDSTELSYDSTELLYGFTLARQEIFRRWENSSSFFDEQFYGIANSKVKTFDGIYNFYVSCFCDARNLLSQWRGYGGSGGYSLDLYSPEFFEALVKQNVKLAKVLYDPKIQDSLINDIIDTYHVSLKKVYTLEDGSLHRPTGELGVLHDPGFVAMDRLIDSLIDSIAELSACFKDPTFAEEREWRLIIQVKENDLKNIKFTAKRGILVPYVEIPILINRSTLSSITCGPSVQVALSRRSVELFLRTRGILDLPVLPSNIPLNMNGT